MKSKEKIAKEIGISRKTLYNYMNELGIIELTSAYIEKIKKYALSKNKSKEISKSELMKQLEELKKSNVSLEEQNKVLKEQQQVLLNQVEYMRNDISNEIREIKQNMTLLLNPPNEEKKSFLRRLFGKK